MKTVSIIATGKTSKGEFWGLLSESKAGFKLRAFVTNEAELTVGEQEIPTEVYKALQWKA